MTEDLKINEGDSQRQEPKVEDKDYKFNDFKDKLSYFFDQHQNDMESAIKDLISRVEIFIDSDFLKSKMIKESLQECSTIKDKDDFINKVSSAMKPYFDFQRDSPKDFDLIARKHSHEKAARGESSHKYINEVLSYEVKENTIAIHLAEARDLGIIEVKRLVLSGLKDLAQIIENREDKEKINEIEAESWIVGKNPGLAEKFGFTLGEIVSETSRMPNVPVRRAYISTEEFLKRYLK